MDFFEPEEEFSVRLDAIPSANANVIRGTSLVPSDLGNSQPPENQTPADAHPAGYVISGDF